jgi:tetratricopeptide (TPR) repeat protein
MDKEKLQFNYQAGKQALERGEYTKSIKYLEIAKQLSVASSRLGGEVQILLVTAYQAAGMRTEAIALCQQLVNHPSLETRKQAKRILFIIEAPQLKRPKEWMSEIPDLTQVAESESKSKYVSSDRTQKSNTQKKSARIPEAIDLSQVNTKDNQFIWVALLLSFLILAGLFWLK